MLKPSPGGFLYSDVEASTACAMSAIRVFHEVGVMRKRCPHCESFSVVKLRRPLWKRLVRRPHRYSCIDCGASVNRDEALTAAETMRRDAQQDSLPSHPGEPGPPVSMPSERPAEANAGYCSPAHPGPISTLLK